MQIAVNIDVDDIVRGRCTDDLRAIERAVDDTACSVDFSLDTIKRISRSLIEHDRLSVDEIVQAITPTPEARDA